MSDPSIKRYKSALTQLGIAVKSAHKTKEGKQMSSDYWVDIIKMLKKAKLGISMMELGIDDESEISTTHDNSKDSNQKSDAGASVPTDSQNSKPEDDSSSEDTDSKLAAIGLKKESNNKLYDTMNHLGILLSEKFNKVSGDGTEVVVDTNNRKFTIKFDDKFFMVTEDYNFELGDTLDLQLVVNRFLKLSSISHENLVKEYNQQVV
jgi:hypothetical protein